MDSIQLFQTSTTIFLKILDITILAILIYAMIRLLVRIEKIVMIVNVVLTFLFLNWFADFLQLATLKFVLNNILPWMVVVVVVVFQAEFRKAFETLGSLDKIFSKKKNDRSKMIEELQSVCYKLAESGTGAIITLEKNISLAEYTAKAIPLNADFSPALLEAIFLKESALHDGAVVVKEGKITHAGTFYPIALDLNVEKEFGTRHRSSITLSRETDSISLIVSEERKSVSIAYRGELYSDVIPDFFIEFLKEKIKAGV